MRSLRRLWNEVGIRLEDVSKSLLVLFLGAYRTIGTSWLGGSCRFEPSCSAYAVEAAQRLRPATAIRLISIRLLKCRPGGPYGYDPVPYATAGSVVGTKVGMIRGEQERR